MSKMGQKNNNIGGRWVACDGDFSKNDAFLKANRKNRVGAFRWTNLFSQGSAMVNRNFPHFLFWDRNRDMGWVRP